MKQIQNKSVKLMINKADPFGLLSPKPCRGYVSDRQMLKDYFALIQKNYKNTIYPNFEQKAKGYNQAKRLRQIDRKYNQSKADSFLINAFKNNDLNTIERLAVAYVCYGQALAGETVKMDELFRLLSDGDHLAMLELHSILSPKGKLFSSGLLEGSEGRDMMGTISAVALSAKCKAELMGISARPQKYKNPVHPYKKTSKSKTSVKIKTPQEIYGELSKYIIGQETAKKALAIAAHKHCLSINGQEDIGKSNILLLGPTGCGKTYLAQVLSSIIEVPFYMADASQYSETGYIGPDVEDIFKGLYQKSRNNPELAAQGIVYIDELDKIASSNDSGKHRSNRDVSGQAVQEELLKAVEGGEYPGRPFKTDKVLFIAGGAFSSVFQTKQNTKAIGFAVGNIEAKSDNVWKPSMADLINYGMLPELLGRFHTRVVLEPLDEDALRLILTEPEKSLVKEYQQLFCSNGIKLVFPEDTLKLIAQKATCLKTGARALRTIMEQVLSPLMFDNLGIVSAKSTITIEPGMIG